jgi:hypothetical protein
MDELFIKPEKDLEDKTPPPSYTFKLLIKIRPTHSSVLISTPSTSHIGLSGFPESCKLGSLTCYKTVGSLKTFLSIASIYFRDGVLYINTNEKLRPEFSIEFIEFLVSEGFLTGQVTVIDSVGHSDYVGNISENIKSMNSPVTGRSNLNNLDPGNSLKGIAAAALLAGEVHGLWVRVLLGILPSYELCVENSRVFGKVFEELNIEPFWMSGINRFEQEKFKHQVYS